MSEQKQIYNIGCSFDFKASDAYKKFTDCTIQVKGEEFRAHRLLLAGASPILAQRFTDSSVTKLQLDEYEPNAVLAFLGYLITKSIEVSTANLNGLLKIACELEVTTLLDICREFLDQVASTRTCLALLQSVGFALPKLNSFLMFCANIVEMLSTETDFSFLSEANFKLLISRARFANPYARDDIIESYLSATKADPAVFDEFKRNLLVVPDDGYERAQYSAVYIASPPDSGLLQMLRSQLNISASGMLNGRNPASLLEENPSRHWFTESDGNAWVLIEFTELFVQPTHYGLWSHGGSSTLRNWAFQASNDRVNWVVLSSHRDDSTIKEPFSSSVWPVDTNGFFKFFRIIQTGSNWSGNRWLYLMKMDIWGIACSRDE